MVSMYVFVTVVFVLILCIGACFMALLEAHRYINDLENARIEQIKEIDRLSAEITRYEGK